MKFFLNGKTYDTDKLETETWEGRYKDDFYRYDTLLPEIFFTNMVEAAKEEGRRS